MKRSVCVCVALVGFAVSSATAQDDSLFRGVGVWYNDLGGVVADAIANRINTETLIFSNQYIYECYKESVRNYTAHVRARSRKVKEAQEATLKRLRESPAQRDVERGDALNMIMVDLLNPKLSVSELRSTPAELDIRTIQQIPFVFRGKGVKISLRRLHISDGDWPTLLNSDEFRRERDAYTNSVEQALEQNLRDRRLKPETIVEVSKTVEAIKVRLDVVLKQKPELGRQALVVEAKEFLKRLQAAAEMLDRKVVTDVIADLDRFSGTTLADLLEFMRNYHLMFASAETPEEMKVYALLFEQLTKQRQRCAQVRPELFRDDWLQQPVEAADKAIRVQ